MYAVRTKSGRVIGRYATRAEAERACRTAKSPAARVFEFRFLRGGLPPMVFYTKKGLDYWLRKNKPTTHSFEIVERPPHRGVEETAIREGRGNDGWLWKESSPVRSIARSPRRTEVEEATAYKAQLAHEASLMPGIRVRLRRGSMTGLEGVLTGRREGGCGVRFDDGFTGVVESRNLEIVHQGSPIRGPARTRLLKVHADVSKKLWAKSPMSRGLKDLPPPGARVRLTGIYLKNTGQQRGGEGASVWTVLGSSGRDFVVVNEPADTSYFTPAEMAADPSLKWRRINKANLQIVGAKPKAGDLP